MAKSARVKVIDTNHGRAYVIDSVLDEMTLAWIDEFRLSLPLDSKRPTVDRRFFADGSILPIDDSRYSLPSPSDPGRPMAHLLETVIQQSINESPKESKGCHVFRYQRFLEYTREGSKLDPHTDGTKICDDTKLTSTHTLLLYLTTCEYGGETLLITECTKEIPNNSEDGILYATQPRRGRILLFPHATPHAGASVTSVPKICLRAEVCLFETTCYQVERATV